MSGIGYAADAEIGGGARFDDCAELREAAENKLLAVADFFEALGIIWALDYFFGVRFFRVCRSVWSARAFTAISKTESSEAYVRS